ncbi:MAG: gamma-glutamyl-gamma-aminobutyrate hydrolase family protein [Thermomicrobiales bacterium]|nr:gamma-glutamyl-gamma-aminobutyrate hydrolase family protein [Thermomicrobiales bacterium]
MKPLIGLTPTPELLNMPHGTFRRHTLSDHYSRAIAAAGGIPVMLPSNFDDADAMLDRLDGVVITGGGDINPAEYEQDQHPKTDEIDSERDAFEQMVLKSAIARDMPILGICRGLQMFNVGLGGTLYQDVEDLKPDPAEHRQQSLGVHAEERFHSVTIAPGEHPLKEIADNGTMEVNSFHHQGIDKLASDLQAIATAEDGLVEAVWHPGISWGMAVQWHPELLAHKYDEHAAIFRSLVEASEKHHESEVNS